MVQATVTLYKDIGLDSNYNRTMLFDSKTEQNTWFNSISSAYKYVLDDVNYNKLQNSFAIHEPIGDVYGYTYVRIQNMDDSGRTYYGFISDVILVDEETTRFNIIIDPIQTFMAEWSLGECLVSREHCDRWGSGDYPIRIGASKEGAVGLADIDSSEEIVQTAYSSEDPTVPLGDGMATMVLVFNKELTVNYGEDDVKETRIFYGLIPVTLGENTINTNFQLAVEGETAPISNTVEITINDIINGSWMDKLEILPEAVIGAYICNPFSIKFLGLESQGNISGGYGKQTVNVYFKSVTAYDGTKELEGVIANPNIITTGKIYCIQVLTETQIIDLLNSDIEFRLLYEKPVKPELNDIASDTHEPAMYMQPFRTDYIVDPSYTTILQIPDVVKLKGQGKMGYSTLVKSTGITDYIYIDGSENGVIGASAMIPANTVDILSDAWRSYCLTQRDSDRRMMWSNIISNTINQAVFMGYGGALVGSRSNSGRNDPMKGGGVDFGGTPGNLSKAMTTAVGYGLGASLITSVVQGVDMWIQQDAKEQAIRNQPSTLTAQSDGVSIGMNNLKHISTKMTDVDYNIAYEKFRKYGYMVNAMEVPNIKSRYYYNYICTASTTIKGAIPANIKQDLVSIFEKGITFFHADHCDTTDYPTNTTGQELENIERSLIS